MIEQCQPARMTEDGRPKTAAVSGPSSPVAPAVATASAIVSGRPAANWMTRRDALRVCAVVAAYTADRVAARMRGEDEEVKS